ncbi:hypothetical protein KKK_03990 [Pseudomonas putida B6-2]|nr:hypothetical protein KKK_03990 [Pseudomonas putida B6-2]
MGALDKYPELIRTIPAKTVLHRVQPSRHDDKPINYRKESDTRYAHPLHEVGVFYLGFSPEVAVVESFQPGQGVDDQAVPLSKLMESSIHRYVTVRELKLVDLPLLANRTGQKLRDIVQAKGQGAEGYKATRALSEACMQFSNEIDGLVYTSAVYSTAGTLDGCNVVLYEGRDPHVAPIDFQAISELVMTNGETAFELLESLGVVVE